MAVTQSQNINLIVDQGTDFSKNLTVTTDGSTNNGPGGAGSGNRGSGGGGNGPINGLGGAGGKGIVIIRYKFQ